MAKKKLFSSFFLLISSFYFCQSLWAQLARPSSGKIIRYENFSSVYVRPRNIDVWLPENYSRDKKYAVLYMQDGQMLFDSTTTWNHQEWDVETTVSQLVKKGKIKECIVVGIWNGGPYRHAEYFPQKPYESLSRDKQDLIFNAVRSKNNNLFADSIQSDHYLKFLVLELKPFIDSAYSVKKNAANTIIAGSSMGGLISIYAICEYPEVFGAAACLSTHWPGVFNLDINPAPEAFFSYLRTHLPFPSHHKIYFDYGTKTLDSLYQPYQLQVDTIMKAKGYTKKNWMTREFIGEPHSEEAWRKRFHIPLMFLLKK
jgi:predicted alpha/beta superfamily hydrolase